MLYRLWTKIRRPYMREWEADNKGPWDAAVRGSSALRAAILTAFADEMGTYSGLEVAKVLWDLEKFYDTINSHKAGSQMRRMQISHQAYGTGIDDAHRTQDAQGIRPLHDGWLAL